MGLTKSNIRFLIKCIEVLDDQYNVDIRDYIKASNGASALILNNIDKNVRSLIYAQKRMRNLRIKLKKEL